MIIILISLSFSDAVDSLKIYLNLFLQMCKTHFAGGSLLPRIFVRSIKNHAKINMGLMGESTQNRWKNQNLRTPSRRVANPSYLFLK